MEIYQATYEKLVHELKEMERVAAEAEKEKRTVIPQGTEDDDAMDMFADSIDSKKGDGDAKDETRHVETGECIDYKTCRVAKGTTQGTGHYRVW